MQVCCSGNRGLSVEIGLAPRSPPDEESLKTLELADMGDVYDAGTRRRVMSRIVTFLETVGRFAPRGLCGRVVR